MSENKINTEKTTNDDEYSHLKIPKGQKFENFDFYELSADISNSLTDKIYRQYLPIIDRKHKQNQKETYDDDLKNDLEVDEIAAAIRAKVKEDLVTSVSDQITKQVRKELSEQYHTNPDSKEAMVDNWIKNIRWVMVPAFLLIAVVMLCLLVIVLGEVLHLGDITITILKESLSGVFLSTDLNIKSSINEAIASILSILDLILLGSLVIMVMIGGYENTVSRVGITHNVPTWFGKLNISELKVKVAASIVIISSIHLLMTFMKLDLEMKNFDPNPIMWTAIIHVVFVMSALILAYMSKLSKEEKKES